MIKLQPCSLSLKLNFLTQIQSEKKHVSKTLKFVFAFVLVIFSLDFGFIRFQSSVIRFLLKTLIMAQVFIVSFVFLYYYGSTLENLVLRLWYAVYIFEYGLLVAILLFTNRTTFADFCNDLWSIDVELGIEPSFNLEYIIISMLSFCLLFRSIISAIYCTVMLTYCITDTQYLVLFFVPLVCADTVLVICFNIYFALYTRLKVFKSIVNNGFFGIVTSHYLYKSLVDIADNIKSVYDPLYVVPLVFHTIDMMITVFYPLIEMDIEQYNSVYIIMVHTSVMQVFVLLFLPAFAAGLLVSQVDELKIVLHNRLLQERDQKHTVDIERFISYIEARPLRTTIWRVIPLDWRLPVIVVNLSITYLIVMLQFTHKY